MAGVVITLAQQKGGAGKTSLAANLAIAWHLMGRDVATLDIDPQGSLTRWHAERVRNQGEGVLPVHVSVTGWRTRREVDRLVDRHAIVVIDSPPHAGTEVRIAVRAAGLVIIPVQPSPIDLWATVPTIALTREEGRPALLVLNRVAARTRLAHELAGHIGALGVPVANARIGNRTALASAMLAGQGVGEGAPGTVADGEIQALANEIMANIA